jgi:hypothetical protein
LPTKPPQVALGYFVRFMVAYGKAPVDVLLQLDALERAWAAGGITDQSYVVQVSSLLGIEPPAVIT